VEKEMLNDTIDKPEAPAEVLHPGSRALFRYWEALRGERAAPDRADLDLYRIRQHVASLFIMERHAACQSYKWRLAGTKVCAIWRQELTGKDVFHNWNAFERDLAGRLLDGVVGSMQPCVMRFRLQTSLGHVIPVEMLCLPLRAKDGRSIHVLGSIMAFSETNTMGYETIARIELLRARAIWTEPLPGDPLAPGPGPSLARPFANFRVIDGGKSSNRR
jgi:hypothetical protein